MQQVAQGDLSDCKPLIGLEFKINRCEAYLCLKLIHLLSRASKSLLKTFVIFCDNF